MVGAEGENFLEMSLSYIAGNSTLGGTFLKM